MTPLKPWLLDSGTWVQNPAGFGFLLNCTVHGRAVSVSADDVRSLLQAAGSVQKPGAIYPPEFNFCVHTGDALQTHVMPMRPSWIPPYGATAMSTRTSRSTRGLRQVATPHKLSRQNQRRADADPDVRLDSPPAGDYEFFSTLAGTRAAVLLALDPAKGLLHLYLPASKRWEPLEHDGGGLLAASRLARPDWRCELIVDGLGSLIFLPSEEGLACLRADAASLGFSVNYVGGAPAIGAPLQLGEDVWVPLHATDGGVRFVSMNLRGEAAAVLELAGASLGGRTLGSVHTPLADDRLALWPCDAGQLMLRKQASGALKAGFLPWPTGVKPAFQFGSPYLSRDGRLWQLCFDAQADGYVYLQLGVEAPERVQTLSPRPCSGTFNFRFANKFQNEPWLEPEQGDDAAADEIVLPLLEFPATSAVLGLRLETTAGLAHLLHSDERMRAILMMDEASSQTDFYSFSVAEPWRLRLFVHDGLLWFYHPLLKSLNGWTLQA